MKRFLTLIVLTVLSASLMAQSTKGVIAGRVVEAGTGNAVIGAAVVIAGTTKGVSTNAEGKFEIAGLDPSQYTIEVVMMTYKAFRSEPLTVKAGQQTTLDISLVEQSSTLDNIVVVATRPAHTDSGLIGQMRDLKGVASGVSSQQIARTQDKDASEVVRRIPGVSIIDDKFVIVRGLAQRYNNTWVNNSAVPSSEADSRAFSFDVIPSSQIDNIMIIKAPTPEYPADFSGGFVIIKTKTSVGKNSMSISYGTGTNSQTHFKDFYSSKSSSTDFLGFDDGMRSMRSFVPKLSETQPSASEINKMTKEGFDNSWNITKRKPILDQKFNLAINRSHTNDRGDKMGLNGSVNYSYTNKSVTDMLNNQYYPSAQTTLRNEYVDNQYTTDAKLGAMLNLFYTPVATDKSSSRYEFRNIVNQIGKSRLTLREGESYYTNREQLQTEYLYQSRTAYSGQFAGAHTLFNKVESKLDWNLAYSYSNRNQPDRRIERRERRPDMGVNEYIISQSSVSRYFNALDEQVISSSVNYTQKLNPSANKPIELRAGVYGEYKWRDYNTRTFNYYWQANQPTDLLAKPMEQILSPDNLGYDKIYLVDGTAMTDDYKANSTTLSAYAAVNIPLGRWNIYGGVRMESYMADVLEYKNNTGTKTENHHYVYNNPLPSVNVTYDINKKSLVRMAYGMTINRPEFRELSRSSYFDFDIFSFVQGDPNLKQASIQSFDLRYELYPSSDELISLAVFYKGFKNPIEWSYVETGAAYEFRYVNADKATNYGIELDMRKKLDFIGLDNFTVVANAAWIKSNVDFEDEYSSYSRPMQGQSPYLVNVGLFYSNARKTISAGALYNRIGKRIIGIGRVISSSNESMANSVPDMYELPRDCFDLTLGVKLFGNIELKAAAKDILSSDYIFAQFPKSVKNNETHTRTQITRQFNPGRNFSLSLSATF